MPEGPEAHTLANTLATRITGLSLVGIETLAKAKQKQLQNIPLPAVVKCVTAHGKRPIIVTDQGYIVTFLGMTGSLTWQPDTHPRILFKFKSCHQVGNLVISYGDDVPVYFNDVRIFGRVEYLSNYQELHHHFTNFGLDLIKSPINLSDFRTLIRSANQDWEICKFLISPKWICSIGNYLKSEILYLSRLRPDRKLSSIPDDYLHVLHQAIHQILALSMEHGGLTISDYKNPDGKPGTYPTMVYMRSLDSYGNCVYKDTFSDNRTTHWVPCLQE